MIIYIDKKTNKNLRLTKLLMSSRTKDNLLNMCVYFIVIIVLIFIVLVTIIKYINFECIILPPKKYL